MKIIVGLGNPGKEHENTRHNVGFVVVEELASYLLGKGYVVETEHWQESKSGQLLYRWFQLGDEKLELVKPQTYMNNSGQAAAYVIKKHQNLTLSDLYIVHDDLDIRLGEYKIQFGKGPKVHNGVNSVEQALGSDQFWHIRIGVDNRTTEERQQQSGQDYVLGGFREDEKEVISRVISKIVHDLEKDLFLD